jgi:hypothetical protein
MPQQQQQRPPSAAAAAAAFAGQMPAGPAKGSDVPRINIGVFGVMNAGKSTLMNAITRQETSIVDATPGTTAGWSYCPFWQKRLEVLHKRVVLVFVVLLGWHCHCWTAIQWAASVQHCRLVHVGCCLGHAVGSLHKQLVLLCCRRSIVSVMKSSLPASQHTTAAQNGRGACVSRLLVSVACYRDPWCCRQQSH